MPGLQLLLASFLLLVEHIYGQRFRFRERRYRPENEYRSRENGYKSRENEFGPNSIDDQACPKNFRCIVESYCRPEALSSIRGPKRTCGYADNWKMRICCPLRVPRMATPRIPHYVPNSPPRPWTSPKHFTPPNPDRECGKPKIQPGRRAYVVGGVYAKPGAWPWMVAITRKATRASQPMTLCTGFLIDRQHVLTAAHCFNENAKRRQHSVMFGDVDLTQSKEYNIKRIITHPGYVNGSFYDDIALLTLTKPVPTHNYSPICLPWNSEFMNVTGRGTSIAGWGVTIPGSSKTSVSLMELSAIPVVSNQQCNRAYSMGVTKYQIDFPSGITHKLICAGLIEKGGKDSCQGDSGGPLMFEINGRWYAIGIVAFGADCGRPGVPGGYTRVTEFLDWIEQNRKDV